MGKFWHVRLYTDISVDRHVSTAQTVHGNIKWSVLDKNSTLLVLLTRCQQLKKIFKDALNYSKVTVFTLLQNNVFHVIFVFIKESWNMCVYVYIYMCVYIYIYIYILINIWSGSKPFTKVVLKPKYVLVLEQLWWTFLIHFKCYTVYHGFYKNFKQHNCFNIDDNENVSWAANQHDRMISEGLCNNEQCTVKKKKKVGLP